MVRSSRASALLVLAAAALTAACGGDEPQPFRLEIASRAAGTSEVPFPVAVVRGVATSVETLTLRVAAGDETYAFTARPGTTMAFRAGGEQTHPPVKLAGLDVEAPSAEEVVRAFEIRLAEGVPDASVRKPAGGDAFVVDLPIDREDLWPAVVGAGSPPADLRFLIEVLPREQYRSWGGDVQRAPRLAAAPYPWSGTSDAFQAFKEAEVERWLKAKLDGQPYEPSRPDLLVLPRAGKAAADVHDFAVLEWPQDPAHRFDGRMLEHALTSKDPTTGKPVVLYDVREPYREAFEAWTGVNLGLPMAIVLDWAVRSAPTIQSALRDKVQITLGSGSWSELEAEAQALTRTLGGTTEGPSATLVAVCTWRPGGAFEVLLPLAERVDTTLVLDARGAAAAEQARVERTLRLVPGIEADAADAVDARLAEIVLGALEVEAAAPLLRAGTAAAVEQLARVARGDVSDVRRLAAVELLGLVDATSPTAVDALILAVDSQSADIALAAVRALRGPARTQDEAFHALLRVASSDQDALRGHAAFSLQGLGDKRKRQLLALGDDTDPAVRKVVLFAVGLEQQDPDVLPFLLSCLQDDVADIRRQALMCLYGWSGGGTGGGLTEHLGAIAVCLEDEDRQVRGEAAGVLAGHGAEAWLVVRPYLDSDRPEVRAAALSAANAKGNPSAGPLAAIEKSLDDPALLVRLTAAAILARPLHESERAHPVSPERLAIAREGLASEDDHERQLGLVIVWAEGGNASVAAPWVVPLLDDDSDELRVMAAGVLRSMGEETERSKAILNAALADGDHPMHDFAEVFEQPIDTE